MNFKFIVLISSFLFFSCEKKTGNDYAKIDVIKFQDFGTINVGDTITKEIIIKNPSNNILRIKNIKASCGCTVLSLKDSIIGKNTQTKIFAKYIAENNDIGEVKKSIIVEANTDSIFTVLYLVGKVEGQILSK